ncbi:hypothetical protein [Schlesneria sp. DSM 10557]|uniref:hypothetical protein n=1 Tax=Schlesneria sp. DSM 10557 TaxID=3044399 RepID=UPI0035A02917
MTTVTVLNVEKPIAERPIPRVPTSLPPRPKPILRRVMQFVRRTHLYVGLLLFPWAILYGVTGFLFNHPTILADAPTMSYVRSDLAGTALEKLPPLPEQAVAIIAALNERHQPATPFRLADGAVRYATRDSFIATVKADQRSFFVTFDPRTASGVIRETTPRLAAADPAPFATGKGDAPRQRGMGMMGPMKQDHTGVKVSDSWTDRLKSAIPVLLKRKGFPAGDVTVTTAPDIKFPVEADAKIWTATFNPLTTSVSGVPGSESGDLSFRAFLLRMHLTRGYPGEMNTKWLWAVGVDAIALTLCFWGVSGLFMWWQIKTTRQAGLVALAVSTVLATALGFGMHGLLAG